LDRDLSLGYNEEVKLRRLITFFESIEINPQRQAVFFYLVTFTFLFLPLFFILDPDFGWHLRTGQLILKQGIPQTDPFSYSMPSFPVVAHSWLSEVIIALLYPLVGNLGLALFSSLLVLLAFWLASRKDPVLTLISSAFILRMVTIRPQIISWLLFSLLLYRFWDKAFWEKWRKFIPLLFIFWVNIHGSFPAGLTVLLIRALFSLFAKRKLTDLFVFLASLAATLVNPYGLGIWREVLATVFDSSLRWRIVEWYPFFLSQVNFLLLGFIVLFLILFFRYRKKVSLEESAIVFFFFFQAMTSVKQVPFWLIVALPFVCRLLGLFQKEILAYKSRMATLRLNQVKKLMVLGSLGIILIEVSFIQLSSVIFNRPVTYPAQAAAFLKKDLPEGRVFSTYNWGGFLIWKLPEKKVFIDGRMPCWKTRKEIPGESSDAFQDYQDISLGKIDAQKEFEKYGIDTVLLPSFIPQDSYLFLLNKLTKTFGFNLGLGPGETPLVKKLQEMGWEKVYEDKTAVIYQKR
jgi:hypothetical protein